VFAHKKRAISYCKIVKQNNSNTTKMKKVTGIGGIFFKCKDPNKINE
jgi:hypothetical protein